MSESQAQRVTGKPSRLTIPGRLFVAPPASTRSCAARGVAQYASPIACIIGIGVLVVCAAALTLLGAWTGLLALPQREKHFQRAGRMPMGPLVALMAGMVGAVLFLAVHGC
jgi:hypothetical protein